MSVQRRIPTSPATNGGLRSHLLNNSQGTTLKDKKANKNKMSLEVHIMSAQKLAKVAFLKRTKAYAVASIDSHDTKLSTGIDRRGGRNPSWNSILTFYVDTEYLEKQHGINAGMTIEIYTRGWFREKLIGTVRVLIADLVKGITESKGKCFTFMVIRPSGRRKGLLNIGVRPERFYEDEIVVYQHAQNSAPPPRG